MDKTQLPPMTQQPVLHVDGTPDDGYVLRILQAYRRECDTRWEVTGLDGASRRIYDIMNEHQEQRAALLDKAIVGFGLARSAAKPRDQLADESPQTRRIRENFGDLLRMGL